ncbi:hypothetical protein GCM10010317_087360 [Streptomyces mirabilis]|nr:hypothetical protein GCM10010317_087360 [Streptomyces mirabilis]
MVTVAVCGAAVAAIALLGNTAPPAITVVEAASSRRRWKWERRVMEIHIPWNWGKGGQ